MLDTRSIRDIDIRTRLDDDSMPGGFRPSHRPADLARAAKDENSHAERCLPT
jgi:hypothetical protein